MKCPYRKTTGRVKHAARESGCLISPEIVNTSESFEDCLENDCMAFDDDNYECVLITHNRHVFRHD